MYRRKTMKQQVNELHQHICHAELYSTASILINAHSWPQLHHYCVPYRKLQGALLIWTPPTEGSWVNFRWTTLSWGLRLQHWKNKSHQHPPWVMTLQYNQRYPCSVSSLYGVDTNAFPLSLTQQCDVLDVIIHNLNQTTAYIHNLLQLVII